MEKINNSSEINTIPVTTVCIDAIIDALLASYLLQIFASKYENEEAFTVASRINFYNYHVLSSYILNDKSIVEKILKKVAAYSYNTVQVSDEDLIKFKNSIKDFSNIMKSNTENSEVNLKSSAEYLNIIL